MRNKMHTALALILASTVATGALAQTNDGTSAAAGVTKGGQQTNNDFAGGNTASDPTVVQPDASASKDGTMAPDQTGNSYAGGDAASKPATAQDGTSASAGTKATANGTGNGYAGGDAPNIPASDVVAGLQNADGAMVGKKIAGVSSIKDVNIVTLSELSVAQNIDVNSLNDALAMQNKMLGDLQSNVASSSVVSDALASKGFQPTQVVGAATDDSNMVTVVVDDRT